MSTSPEGAATVDDRAADENAVQEATAPLGAAPPVAPDPTSLGPYRRAERSDRAPGQPRAWPTLGPTFSVFGALLWSYVVAGQLTTSWTLGTSVAPGLALAFVLGVTLATLRASLRRSQLVGPARRPLLRGVIVSGLAVAMFFACVVTAVVLGHGAEDELVVATGLVAVAVLGTILGSRWTSTVPTSRTPGQRFLRVVSFVAAALLTVFAGLDLSLNR